MRKTSRKQNLKEPHAAPKVQIANPCLRGVPSALVACPLP